MMLSGASPSLSESHESAVSAVVAFPPRGWSEPAARPEDAESASLGLRGAAWGAYATGGVGATTVLPPLNVPLPRTRRVRTGSERTASRGPARWIPGREVIPAEGNRSQWYQAVKRAVDIVGALALLVLFSPIMLAAYVALLVTTRGKPIFCQVRSGYRGRPFTMYKFRTMVLEALERQHEVKNEQDGPVFKNRRDPRVTRLGRFLRSTSIDEMPQLFNVLLGQMSLVGPRPALPQEAARYEPWQRRRMAVKPGLTCLWQISGRSDVGFERWVRMDLWYVQNQSLLTDLKLLARTPWSVLSRRGAY
jgi:lipopolysaccharide/colanic/teichoic acid biosynthesis glycosyltransferase